MKKIHPYLIILISFLVVILMGSIMLSMPFASKSNESIGFINALFMSTSSVCVTGLSVMPNGLINDLTVFGNIVMVILMQIGGLSFITIAVFFFTVLGGKLGIVDAFLLKESLNQNSFKGLLNLVKKIMLVSFLVQGVCSFINVFPIYEYVTITNQYKNPVLSSFAISIFHSAASFNNAGFDLFGSNSMEFFSSSSTIISKASIILINSTTIFMIVIGGIGFTVILDVLKNKKWKKFSLHTKITLLATLMLIIGGMILVKLTSDMSILDSLFTSVTSRTAGFATYNMSKLESFPAAYLIIILLMIIGASPCSTGGGIKTTTFAVLILSIISYAKGKKTKVFNRKIGEGQIFKAYALVVVAMMIVMIATILISISQPNLGFQKIFFEVVSAFSTTGLSMGITPNLNIFCKLIIIILMFLGRIGPLTVIGLVNKNWMASTTEKVQYVEEGVIIG